MKRLLFVILVFTHLGLGAQISISGMINNSDSEAVPYINVLICKPGSEIAIAFAVSNEKGHFQTNVNVDSDSLDIKLSSVHYRNVVRRIPNKSQELQFLLTPEVMELESITVKAAAIEQRGDTIVYLVNSFAKQEDRSIEDVLRRMPGIEVEPSGRILYQGLPLQKFYVEGLDLMDGRYVVISKNLPQTSVSSVEVLENHQPVRILEDKIASNQASLNIKLKHNISATGTAKLGAGFGPFLWEANITPMIFMKRFQVLISYQANNIGDDVSKQLSMNTLQDLIHQLERPAEKPEILDIHPATPPEIEEDRYLDNNIQLLNMNGLIKLSNDMQLRANLFYINDFQQQKTSTRRTHFTPEDTISYVEDFSNRLYENYLFGEFTLNRNVKENFLENELKFQTSWDKTRNDVINNNRDIYQGLDHPFRNLSNDLRSISPLGDYLLEVNSYISIDNSPHELGVEPGQFEHILNDSLPYNESYQSLDLSRFYTDNSAGIVLGWKGLTFTPRAGFTYRDQKLESQTFSINQDSIHDPGMNFSNLMRGKHIKVYANTGIEYSRKRLNLKAHLPICWQDMNLMDSGLDEGQQFTGIFFDPRISLTYKIKGFWKLRGAWSYKNSLGDMDRIHYAFILKNYRTLSRNAAPISHSRRNNYSAYISYRNPIISFFNSLTYVYSISDNNLLYSSIILEDGTSLIQPYEKPNTAYYHSLQFQSSKFISKIKTNVSFRAAYNQRNGLSLLNAQFFNTKTVFYNLVPEINLTITRWLNAEYGLHASFINTFLEEEEKSNISIYKHKFDAFAYPLESHMLSMSAEYYNLHNTDNFFLDLLYRFTLKKQKLDFEIRWNNIFNNATYISYFASAYTVTESVYYLRPSQVLFSVKFSY